MVETMPDTIVPYISKGDRLRYLTKDTIRLSVDEKETVSQTICQLRQLDDDTFCLLTTVMAPERETTCTLYDGMWRTKRRVSFDDVTMTQKPDTMSEKEYRETLDMIEFPLVEARFGNGNELILTLNAPMLDADDRKKVEAISMQRILKWDGESFK